MISQMSGNPVTNTVSAESPTILIGINFTLFSALTILTPKWPSLFNENSEADN